MKVDLHDPSSFRDPDGFLFYQNGSLCRAINTSYKEHYDYLMDFGLYKILTDKGLLIPHKEVESESLASSTIYKVIKPEVLPFVSYPYEWCFSQLKQAALATLEVQKIALDFGMSLKDSSAYNIQFIKSRPVFIDTLSFEKYSKDVPWPAYKQFCQHFLAPLALMSYKDIRLNQMLKLYIDGIPLDLASLLLPFRSRFDFSLFSHIHMHAKSQSYFSDKSVNQGRFKVNKTALLGIIDSLESAIKRLICPKRKRGWSDYYARTNYSNPDLLHKKQLVSEFLDELKPKVVWDLGANTGVFSRIAADKGMLTISFDLDPYVIEENYMTCVRNRDTHVYPLLMDLTNPSPGIGWGNNERMPLAARGPADTIMALALIHHLAISNNLPIERIARYFSRMATSLIIEFVPKSDSQVQRLLSTRKDIFFNYSKEDFEAEFSKYFKIKKSVSIKDIKRFLYLMEKR